MADQVSHRVDRIWKPHYCLKKSTLTEGLCKQLRPASSRPLRLYRHPNIHKEGVPLRPTVSSIGTPTYQLSKYLAGLLKHLILNSAHHIKKLLPVRPDTGISTIKTRWSNGQLWCGVPTKVPIVDSLELLSHHFEYDVLALFIVLTSIYFCFEGHF